MAGHAQQLGQVDGQEAQKGEGPGLRPGAGSCSGGGMGLKRQGLHQHGGAVGSPAAHCPPTSLEMGTEAGLPR